MRGVEVAAIGPGSGVPGYQAPTVRVTGEVVSDLFAPDGFSLWLAAAGLQAGATLSWEGNHGDEALYVLDGVVEVEGVQCPSGGVVLIESGVAASVTALSAASVLHFGPHDPLPPVGPYGAPSLSDHRVHVIGPGGTHAVVDSERDTRFYADSTCTGCRITLFMTGRFGEQRPRPHSHSEDEILYILRGGIALGRREVPPGSAMAVQGGRRYAFSSSALGYSMLNYRRDVSYYSSPDTPVPFLEGGSATGMPAVDDVLL